MAATVYERLQKVLGAVRAAEQARLAEVLSRRAQCLETARRLRAQATARGPGVDSPPDAATLLALAGWRARLLRDASVEEARARDLEDAAGPLRKSLALAFGRERAAGDLAARARVQARSDAVRRTEAEVVPRGQPLSSPMAPSGGTGSPGIA
jgi:hypothetical protein